MGISAPSPAFAANPANRDRVASQHGVATARHRRGAPVQAFPRCPLSPAGAPPPAPDAEPRPRATPFPRWESRT